MSPSATVGPAASCVDDRVDLAVELVGRHRPVDRAPVRGLGARERPSEQEQLARPRTSPTRRGSSQVAPLSGVKPALAERLPEAGVVGRDAEVGGERELEAEPGGPAPHRAHDRDLRLEHERDQPVGLRRQPALDAAGPGSRRRPARCGRRCRRRSRSGRPAPRSSDDAHRLVGAGRGERVDEPEHH